MLSPKSLAIARVAVTFAGTVIGAGFASGQEISQFFVSYGRVGLWGVVVAAGLFAWLGGALLDLGFRRQVSAYYEAIYQLCGRRLGVFLDVVTVAFLFVALAVMLAGAATVARDYFGVTYVVGLACAGLAVILTVLYGVRGIVTANLIVAPLLVLSIIVIGIYSLTYHNFNIAMLDVPQPVIATPAPHWLLGSLLYVSYNLVVCSTVLLPLGRDISNRQIRLLGGIIGGIILGLLAMLVAIVTLVHGPGLIGQEVPILYIASRQSYWSGMLYALMLLAAIYTTAIAALFGCLAKARSIISLPPAVIALAITIAALLCGQAGFSNLIRFLFPVFGYATFWFIIRLAWFSCRGS